MARKSVSKLYRKLVTTECEYQRFRILERLNEKEAKQMLMIMIHNQQRKREAV
ncbi:MULTISPECIES: hypothetical protein [Allobacillus]|uniref:hypothetical protein n=1 Tax=Allobacillus TaxID=1400133 RepID=UPI00164310CE|nr:hypothetical protein [Allobacillus salarius]